MLLIKQLYIELQLGCHSFFKQNSAQTLEIMSIIVKLMRIIVKQWQNMLPYGHSAFLSAHSDAGMFLGLLWPVKQLGTGPGFVC